MPEPTEEEKDDETVFDPHKHRSSTLIRPTTDFETMIHIVNGCFGTGIMATPQAFKYVGLINGLVSTVIIGLFCIYTLHILVKAEYKICQLKKVGVLDYQAAVTYAVEVGPKKTQKFAKAAGYTADGFMVVMQLGIGCVYIVFVAKNLKRFTDHYIEHNYSVIMWMTFTLPAFILSILLPDLRWLSAFSTIGNTVTVIAFGIISYYAFKDIPSIKDRDLFLMDMNYPLYFGTTLFALESIGVITTAEKNMKNPHHFLGVFGVLSISLCINVVTYIFLGFFGYWKYGPDTLDSITLNIPHDEILGKTAIMLYVFAIYFSYNLQCYVANLILWRNYIVKWFKNSSERRICVYEYIFRVISVLFTYGLSVGIPLLGLFISLIGSLCMASLAFIFPCIMDICVRWPNELGRHKWILYHHIVIMIIGSIGIVVGTYVAVRDIVTTIHNSKRAIYGFYA